MLDLIKSFYITKIIFSYVNEGQKLKILKYTKNLQKNIDIGIINYKLFKGKYIIYEPNRIGKEYNKNDNLIFEGEYLNGKRNGKGKEYYDNGQIKFEGEYLDGKILVGIKYDYKGTIIQKYNSINNKSEEFDLSKFNFQNFRNHIERKI